MPKSWACSASRSTRSLRGRGGKRRRYFGWFELATYHQNSSVLLFSPSGSDAKLKVFSLAYNHDIVFLFIFLFWITFVVGLPSSEKPLKERAAISETNRSPEVGEIKNTSHNSLVPPQEWQHLSWLIQQSSEFRCSAIPGNGWQG